ncbi:MAG TPA: hypothetical protein PLM75_06535 [bacterium]|nr:hypothetical protein [bacterium]
MQVKYLVLIFFIIFFLSFDCLYAEEKIKVDQFIKSVEQKLKSIKTLYTDIDTNGYDQDNRSVNLKVFYWKDREKIKKIVEDGSDTMTTLILGDTFYVHYHSSNMLIVNNVKQLSSNELKNFKMQNQILEYYKLSELLKDYDIKNIVKKNNDYIINLESKNKRENIEIVFANNYDLKTIKSVITEKNQKQEFNINFKVFRINDKISSKIFEPDFLKFKDLYDSAFD